MRKGLVQKEVKTNINIQWLCQLIASLSWFTSVIVYGSFELGGLPAIVSRIRVDRI